MRGETTTPKAGEYWFPTSGKPYLCLAANGRGESVWANADQRYFAFGDDHFWKHWHHEPRCTSFDWVEPHPPKYCVMCGVDFAVGGSAACAECFDYSVEATMCPNRPGDSGYDPDDMPLNPVPGKVVAKGTLKLTPVELPDDWVEILNPDHILRKNIDQILDTAHGYGGCRWVDVYLSAGAKQSSITSTKCRCRRKDLPVAVPCYQSDVTCSVAASERERKEQPVVKRVPVGLIATQLGNVIWRQHGAALDATDRFLFSDGNGGWCVEVPQ